MIANLGKQIRIEGKDVPEWFLGIKIHISEKRKMLPQERNVKKLNEKWNVQKCKQRNDKILIHHSFFQQLEDALLYSAVTTRPDISFAVNLLFQACTSPAMQDFIAAKRVLHYPICTIYFLTYSRHDNGLGILRTVLLIGQARQRPEKLYLAWLLN